MRKIISLLISTSLLGGCASAVQTEGTPAPSQSSQVPKTQAPEPEPLPTFELSSLNENPDVCKIREDSRIYSPEDPVVDFSGLDEIRGKYKGNATAFPFRPTTLPTFGELNVAVVPVDWSDAAGSQQELDFYESQANIFADFWYMVSEGNLSVRIQMPNAWQRIPGSVDDFRMTREDEGQRYNERPKKQLLYDAITAASDDVIDYSSIDIVLPVWPLEKTVSEWGGPHEFNFDWNAAMYTDEKTIYDIAGAGDWFLDHIDYGGPWFYYVHEVGHMLGFVHLPDEDGLYSDLDWQESWWLQNGTSGLDVMGNQDGGVKTIGSWLRWLAGWLDDSQVICVTEDSIVDEFFELNHLNDISGGVESLVIKLSETQVIVVESRRWDERFDRPIVHSRDGVFAYVVTSTRGASQNSQQMISPRKIQDWVEVNHWRGSQEIDGTFCEGDVANVSNLRIEAVSLQDGKDYVRVTKTDEWVDPNGPAAGSVTGQPNFLENGCVFPPGADTEFRKSLGLSTSN